MADHDSGSHKKVAPLRALELFCGIGGFAAAVAGTNVQVVGAMDQSALALSVYRHNFPGHCARQVDLERVSAWELTAPGATLWWLSPPCQPYCERGCRRDLDDPRSRSLLRLLELLRSIPDDRLPRSIALENVGGFTESLAREQLLEVLGARAYLVRERLLCPTELGIPSRRPRYYLVASRTPLSEPAPPRSTLRTLAAYIPQVDDADAGRLRLPDGIIDKFGPGLRILDRRDPAAYTTCFTSGYGKSIVNAGSYLSCGETVRHFSPEEIARLLHFPDSFRFPEGISLRKQWQLVGNSLSVAAVREVLKAVPGIEFSGK